MRLSKRFFLTSLLVVSNSLIAATPIAKIVGGTVAPNHAYPFMAAIEFSSDNFQYCGGTLIAPNKVLTAAHCVETAEPIHVRLGTNNRITAPGKIINVISQVRHPKFNANTFDYDVAVFTLASSAVLSDNINLIGMPEACVSGQCITGLTKSATLLKTIGWGAQRGNGTLPSDNLREVNIPVVANPVCSELNGGGITGRMMCAGFLAGGKDSCSGDSGGPLFGYLPIGRAGLQAGIVSFGVSDCAASGFFGVYTRISNLEIRSFIRQQSGK